MKLKKLLIAALALCLLPASVPAASAAEPGDLWDLIERLAPQLDGGLEGLSDWLSGKSADLAPELIETLRDLDTEHLLEDMKNMAGDTKELDDAALKARIEQLAEQHGIHLVEQQVEQLMKLFRTLERLDPSALRERAGELQEQLEVPGGLRGVWNSAVKTFKSAVNWITEKARSIFG